MLIAAGGASTTFAIITSLGVTGSLLLYVAIAGAVASATVTAVQAVKAEQRSKRNAKRLEEQGKIALAERRRQGQRLLAAQRAAIGATGLEPLGTPIDVLSATAAEEELAAQREQFKFEDAAFVTRERAKIEKRNQLIGAGITVLGGVSAGASQALGSNPEQVQVRQAPAAVKTVRTGGLLGTVARSPRTSPGLRP